MKGIAIITARGGSKRIPRKNIKPFLGKPIITYSIRAALESGTFDEVMVSTDDTDIAAVAESAGAVVPFLRSAENANDFATTADVLREVLEEYSKIGKTFDTACCIYPTAPFVTADKLSEAAALLEKSGADSVIPVVAYSFPPQRGIVIREGKASYLYPEYANTRSQDLETIYHDCGQFYCFRTDRFLASGCLVGKNTIPLIVNELEVQDIDNFTDWKLAENKYRLMTECGEDEV